MPNRILREGIITSPRIAKLGWPEEVLYRRLMSVVDDYGRYYADAGMMRAACYPRQLGKVADSDVGKWTRNLVEAGLVRVYPASDGESYLELLDFRQQVRAKDSKFPDPPSTCVADAKQVPANARLDVDVFVYEDGGVFEGGRLREPAMQHRSIATELGVNCDNEFSRYRDYLKTHGKTHKNEANGFRNWLRKAAEFKPKANVADMRQTVNDEIWKGSNGRSDRDITGESERVA